MMDYVSYDIWILFHNRSFKIDHNLKQQGQIIAKNLFELKFS
jgi:hypothetical protein